MSTVAGDAQKVAYHLEQEITQVNSMNHKSQVRVETGAAQQYEDPGKGIHTPLNP